jgi:hypothetical protein
VYFAQQDIQVNIEAVRNHHRPKPIVARTHFRFLLTDYFHHQKNKKTLGRT